MDKLERKLDEGQALFDELGLGWLLKHNVKGIVNFLGKARLRKYLLELAEILADDGDDSGANEYLTEPLVKKVVIDRAGKGFDKLEQWVQ